MPYKAVSSSPSSQNSPNRFDSGNFGFLERSLATLLYKIVSCMLIDRSHFHKLTCYAYRKIPKNLKYQEYLALLPMFLHYFCHLLTHLNRSNQKNNIQAIVSFIIFLPAKVILCMFCETLFIQYFYCSSYNVVVYKNKI